MTSATVSQWIAALPDKKNDAVKLEYDHWLSGKYSESEKRYLQFNVWHEMHKRGLLPSISSMKPAELKQEMSALLMIPWEHRSSEQCIRFKSLHDEQETRRMRTDVPLQATKKRKQRTSDKDEKQAGSESESESTNSKIIWEAKPSKRARVDIDMGKPVGKILPESGKTGIKPSSEIVEFTGLHYYQPASWMRAYGKENNHTAYIVHEVLNKKGDATYRNYMSFPTLADFVRHRDSLDPFLRSFHEFLHRDRPCRLFFDTEWTEPRRNANDKRAYLDRVQYFIDQHLKPALAKLGVTDPTIAVLKSSRAKDKQVNFTWMYKHSYHIIVRNVWMENNHTAMKRFYRDFIMPAVNADAKFRYLEAKQADAGLGDPNIVINLSSEKCLIDEQMTSTDRMLRAPGCHKPDDSAQTDLLFYSVNGESCPPWQELFVTDHRTLQQLQLDKTIHVFTCNQMDQLAKDNGVFSGDSKPRGKGNKKKQQSQGKTRPLTEEDKPLVQQITEMLHRAGDLHTKIVSRTGTTLFNCSDNDHVRTCLVTGRQHNVKVAGQKKRESTQGCYITIKNKADVWYHCRSTTCKKTSPPAKKKLGRLNSPEVNTETKEHIDEWEITEERAKPLGITQYETYDRSCMDAVPVHRPRVTLHKSRMGSKKTTALVPFIREWLSPYRNVRERILHWTDQDLLRYPAHLKSRPEPLTEQENILIEFMEREYNKRQRQKQGMEVDEQQEEVNKSVRVLILGCRIQFCDTMKAKFPQFHHYRESTGSLRYCNQLILEYESLHRIDNCEPFDVILMDESESILSTCVSVTNKNQLDEHAQLFADLVQAAQRVVCLDADLSMRTVTVMSMLAAQPLTPPNETKNEEISISVNTNQDMKRSIRMHNDFDCWMRHIENDVKSGKKLCIVLGSRRIGTKIEDKILKPLLGIKYRFYRAKDSYSEDFRNLNTCWKQFDVVMFTPRVTVGASFDEFDYFDQIYVYGTPQSVVVRTLFQMIGRVRFPKSELLHVYINRLGTPTQAHTMRPETLAEVEEELRQHGQIVRMECGKQMTYYAQRERLLLPGEQDTDEKMELRKQADEKRHQEIVALWQELEARGEHLLDEKDASQLAKERYMLNMASRGTFEYTLIPNWINKAQAYDILERNISFNNYAKEFKRHAARLGFTDAGACCARPILTKEQREQNKLDAEADHEAEAKRFNECPLITLSRAREIDRASTQTEEEQLMLCKYNHQLRFTSPITYDHYVATARHMHQIEVARLYLDGKTIADLMPHDQSKNVGNYAENSRVIYSQMAVINELCGLLGLSSSIDTTTIIVSTFLEAKRKEIVQLITDKANTEFKMHYRADSAKRNAQSEKKAKETETAADEKGKAEMEAECKLENELKRDDEKDEWSLPALKGAINQVFTRWNTGKLKQLKVKRTGPRGKQNRVYFYQLHFAPLQPINRNVLDLAKDYVDFDDRYKFHETQLEPDHMKVLRKQRMDMSSD